MLLFVVYLNCVGHYVTLKVKKTCHDLSRFHFSTEIVRDFLYPLHMYSFHFRSKVLILIYWSRIKVDWGGSASFLCAFYLIPLSNNSCATVTGHTATQHHEILFQWFLFSLFFLLGALFPVYLLFRRHFGLEYFDMVLCVKWLTMQELIRRHSGHSKGSGSGLCMWRNHIYLKISNKSLPWFFLSVSCLKAVTLLNISIYTCACG